MDPITLIIVCPLVFLAGVVDAVAGGGGLVSLTAYLLAGLPAHTAIATNKLSSTIGTAAATFRFMRGGFVKLKPAIPAAIGALAGSAIGARLALLTPDGIFQIVLIVSLPLVAIAVLRKPDLGASKAEDVPLRRRLAIILAISLTVGIYDGFYGPGTGTFMLLAFVVFGKLGIKEASGETKIANLASNVAALITFLHAGVVWIGLGLIAAAFSIIGNYIGAGLVLKGGTKIVRPIIIVVISLLFIKVIADLVM